jgi:hypothetical protein
MTVDLYVVACLDDINTIEHVEETLSFDRHGEFVIKHVKKDVCSTLVWRHDGKVINLAFEDNTIAVNRTQIKTWFMYGWCETELAKDMICVLFLQIRGFAVALHSREYWYNLSVGNWRPPFVIYPPFIEGPVWLYIKPLFRRRCLGKSVTNIGTVDDKVLGHGNCIEQTRAGLVDAVGICFVEYLDRSRLTGAVADASCLFTAIECLDVISPHKVEHCVVLFHGDGFAEHHLFVILIQLKIFQVLPFGSVVLLEEVAAGESHDSCHIVMDVPRFNNVVPLSTLKDGSVCDEVQAVIQLVMGELQEVIFGHNGEAFVGYIW